MNSEMVSSSCSTSGTRHVTLSGGFKGGAFGASAPSPRRKSRAHILTYAYQGYLTSRYDF